MTKTVVGLFDNYAEAQNVVQDLIDNGFTRDEISMFANESAKGVYDARQVGDKKGDDNKVGEGAGAGAVGGTVLGGAVGLLVGAGLLAIPGIGPVLAVGPLAAAIGSTAASGLVGAGIGAAAGGLLGGLIGAGIPEEDAEYYTEGVRRGGTLVTLQTTDHAADSAHNIMKRHGAIDIQERGTEWRRDGWTGYDSTAEPYNADIAGNRGYDDRPMKDHDRTIR